MSADDFWKPHEPRPVWRVTPNSRINLSESPSLLELSDDRRSRLGQVQRFKSFEEYYDAGFYLDLEDFRIWASLEFFSHRETTEKITIHSVSVPAVFAIQEPLIQKYASRLACWGEERLFMFCTAIFFQVLIDQFTYINQRSHYDSFQRITRFPKFRGRCPSNCSHRRPVDIFAFVYSLVPNIRDEEGFFQSKEFPRREQVFNSAAAVIQTEISRLLGENGIGINPKELWDGCESHARRLLRDGVGPTPNLLLEGLRGAPNKRQNKRQNAETDN